MEALLTWKYFVIPAEKFEQVKPYADELHSLRDRELTEQEVARKEELMETIDIMAKDISDRIIEYKDSETCKDGTIIEELVYRMDEAPELRKFTEPDEFYFPFLVYITPDGLQKQYETINKIFEITANHDLLKKEFLGEWEYLDRAKQIFAELVQMYKEAFEKNCGIVKIDKLDWKEDSETEEVYEEVESDMIDA